MNAIAAMNALLRQGVAGEPGDPDEGRRDTDLRRRIEGTKGDRRSRAAADARIGRLDQRCRDQGDAVDCDLAVVWWRVLAMKETSR